jgi:transposase InsO family protein
MVAIPFHPLTQAQEEFLKNLYYEQGYTRGRDALWNYIRDNHPDQKISRRAIADWLSNQQTHQLFAAKKNKKSSKPIITTRKTLQIDLVDMITYKGSNNNYSYILNCIDIESRFVFSYKLLNKSVEEVSQKILPLLQKYDYKVLSSDRGNEFNINLPDGITHLKGKAYNPTSQSVVERFNGTLKRVIFKIFQNRNSFRWIDILDKTVEQYNNSRNRGIQNKTPKELFDDVVLRKEIREKVIERLKKSNKEANEKILKIGDMVRIQKKQEKDNKSEQNFTSDIYTIIKVLKSKNVYALTQYQLKNTDGTVLKGYYNITEILPINKSVIPPQKRILNENNKRVIRRIDMREINELNRLKEPETTKRRRI